LVKWGYKTAEPELYKMPGNIIMKRHAQYVEWKKEEAKNKFKCPFLK